MSIVRPKETVHRPLFEKLKVCGGFARAHRAELLKVEPMLGTIVVTDSDGASDDSKLGMMRSKQLHSARSGSQLQ
jgi:hypothetical protein